MAIKAETTVLITVTIHDNILNIAGENPAVFTAGLKRLYSWLYTQDFDLKKAVENFEMFQAFEIMCKAFGLNTPPVPSEYEPEIFKLMVEHFPDIADPAAIYDLCKKTNTYKTLCDYYKAVKTTKKEGE